MAAIHSCSSSSSSLILRFLISASLSLFFLFSSFNNGYAFERRQTTQKHQNIQHTTHHTIQITSLLPSSVCSHSPKDHSKGASMKVVDRRGPCFQTSQDKAKVPTDLTQILSHDQSRVNSIHTRLGFNSGKNSLEDSEANLPAKSGSSLGSGNYVVTIGLGTPKRDLSLIFDTGSDLTWTQCQPCVRVCYKQQEPILDPSKSTTYSNISCNSAVCSQLSSATGNSPSCSASACVYGIQYGDQSFSVGFFGKEKLTLTPTDVFDGFLFGCGQNNQGLFGGTAGLLGLGRDKLSVVSQTAQKYGKYFSYCLPSSSSSTGHLTFGKGGNPSALKFTTLVLNPQNPSFYFIDIVAIAVGGKTLPINKSVFSTAGTIIDSGTVITRLPPDAYTPLKSAFRQQMKGYPMAQPLSILDTCYDFSNYNTVNIPTISFIFSGNARLDIDQSGILYASSTSQVCLAFAGNSDAGDVAIFGNVQQQTLEVVYDVAGGKLGFGHGGCA
ncbi:aspartyl protease family protein At5g10770-like [Cornus florida]|uniref:aspartyl protease family protein At5g10770-like n=1 Tax=Cornus florida TaxID=4283 RepID=UPI0028985B04|nr:aspartyl protease family protein At5g10770-like [Cornus florida]